MCVAVVEFNAIAVVRWEQGCCKLREWGMQRRWEWHGVVGAMITSSLGSEPGSTQLLMLCKMGEEVEPSVICSVAIMPCCDGMVIDSCLGKRHQGELNGGTISNGHSACNGSGTDCADALPEVFKWSIRIPGYFQELTVVFQILGCELSICGAEVGQDGDDGDIRISKIRVFQCLGVDVGHGDKNLSPDAFINRVMGLEFSKGMIVGAIDGGDDRASTSSRMDREGARMLGVDVGETSAKHILRSWHGET